MKKAITLMLFAALLLSCFAGCEAGKENPAGTTAAAEPVTTTEAPPAQTTQATETTAPETTEEPAPVVTQVVYEKFQNDDEYCTAYLIVQGLRADGAPVWEYRTPDCAQTELETVQLFAETDEVVYINEQGIPMGDNLDCGYITALDRQTGETLWRNNDCRGASLNACFDENGVLYYCGYYGPDCTAVDTDGNILWTVAAIDADCWWPYAISYEAGVITVTYEGTSSGYEEYRCLTTDGEQFIAGT